MRGRRSRFGRDECPVSALSSLKRPELWRGLRGAREGPEEIEQLAMMGPATENVAGAKPAAMKHGKEKTEDDCCCPSGGGHPLYFDGEKNPED